jgi:hypothetical protein
MLRHVIPFIIVLASRFLLSFVREENGDERAYTRLFC